MRGRTAGRLPTVVSPRISAVKVPPMMLGDSRLSPVFASPRACSTARLADDPVPQGERSTRPGFSVVQVTTEPSG